MWSSSGEEEARRHSPVLGGDVVTGMLDRVSGMLWQSLSSPHNTLSMEGARQLVRLPLPTTTRQCCCALWLTYLSCVAPVACRSFLTQYAAVLNWNTTTTLLESYGRLEELEVFAGAKGDQEALLEFLMRNPDGAKR